MSMTQSFGENLRQGVFPVQLPYTFADPFTQPFWDGLKEEKLVMQRCAKCGTFRMPPTAMCFKCQAEETEWVELAGTGVVYTFTVVRHPLHPGLAPVVPYVSGVVELDGTQGAGARMLVNIIDCDPETIDLGDRVEIVYEHVNDEMTVARFKPIVG